MKDFKTLSLTIQGVKNIKEKVTLNLSNISKLSLIRKKKLALAGIYGPNGSGKTALITAIQIAQTVVLHRKSLGYYSDEFLYSILNKDIKRFFFSVDFALFNDFESNKTEAIYRYTLSLREKDSCFRIEEEKIEQLSLLSLNEKPKFLIGSKNGALVFSEKEETPMQKLLIAKTTNLLNGLSFLFSVLENDKPEPKGYSEAWEKGVLYTWLFFQSIEVVLKNEDRHFPDIYLSETNKEEIPTKERHDFNFSEKLFSLHRQGRITFVRKKDIVFYEKHINRLTAFIRVFKPELKSIEINRLEDKDVYLCTNILVYPTYRINEEFESNGIRQLIRLYDALEAGYQGKIVFIDEMDLALSGIYLSKILLFFEEYAKGQLILTAHSLETMDQLRRYSLFFLGEDNRLIKWVNNGHYLPSKVYPDGLIEGIPFNQDEIDFLPAFSEDEEKTKL